MTRLLKPAGVVSLLWACFVAVAFAQADAARERRIEGAKKEGEVFWYTAMNTNDAEPIKKRFQEKYPFLRLTVLRQPGEKIRNRILTEAQSGRNFWDVVSFNHLDMDTLEREQLLATYASPETASGFPPGAVDPRGRWAAIYVRQFVIGYNTREVSPSEAPKDWADLLQPRWKSKFAMDEDEVEWFAGMLDYLGPEKGRSFMRALARQQPQQRRGHTLLSKLLAAGDFPLALVHAAEMEEARKNGAPVDWVKTLDPIITSPSQVAISARAPHPNAARLLVDFLLSAEGQAMIRDRGRVPARLDVIPDAPSGLKVHYSKPEMARELDRHDREFRETFARAR